MLIRVYLVWKVVDQQSGEEGGCCLIALSAARAGLHLCRQLIRALKACCLAMPTYPDRCPARCDSGTEAHIAGLPVSCL